MALRAAQQDNVFKGIRILDSDCVSFLAANVSFFGRGSLYLQFDLLQAEFLEPVLLSLV